MKSNINFIGIGAQKSGTSWLYSQFEKSNQIDLPPKKELHYFDRSKAYPSPNFLTATNLSRRLVNPKWTIQALLKLKNEKQNRAWFKNWFFSNYTDDWYLSLFQDYTKCTGEITPAYAILKEEDIAKMSKLLGRDTKIIYMLRQPVERAWSSYKYMHKTKNYSSKDFEHAKTYMYSDYQVLRSQYQKTIQVYKKYFNSVCVGFFDAIIENPKALLVDVFDYLDLDTSEIEQFSGLDKRVNTSKEIQIPKDVESLLLDMYKDQISELASLYGEYFKKWNNPKHFQTEAKLSLKPSIVI